MADKDNMPKGWEFSNRYMELFDFQHVDTQRMIEPAEPTFRYIPAEFPGVQLTANTPIPTELSDQISDEELATVAAQNA